MEAQAKKTMNLCVVAQDFDVDPFRPIGDGTRHSILDIVLKDYISTEPGLPGLLEAFHFSADGKTFSARVAKDAKWRDGTPLSSLEAALGIAKGLRFRAGGETIRVLGAEKINEPGWEQRTYAGVRVVDERQFELTFDASTPVANRVGVIREMLSSGSLTNRLWPVRIEGRSAKPVDDLGDFVSNYGFRKDGPDTFVVVGGHSIKLHLDAKCDDPDFTSSAARPKISSRDDFEFTQSGRVMALLAFFNPKRPGFDSTREREQVGSWFRHVIQATDLSAQGAKLSSGHFEKLESGFTSSVVWKAKSELPASPKALTILAANKAIPHIREGAAIEAAAKAVGLRIEWVYRGADLANVDVVLHPGGVLGERQVWLESATTLPLVKELIPQYKKTLETLVAIRERSASTIPIDAALLSAFEVATHEEMSIVPLSRYAGFTLSRKGLPVKFAFLQSGRVLLSVREGAK